MAMNQKLPEQVDSETVYQYVARQLRDMLGSGEIPVGQQLPTYRELAKRFQVSLSVIQRAMRQLKAEAVVSIAHGQGVKAVRIDEESRILPKFAMIHPYRMHGFGITLATLFNQVFESRQQKCMAILRSSQGDCALERKLATSLYRNGVNGLIVSPVNPAENREFFESLAREIPVVLIDQVFEGTTLPAVLLDYASAGGEIGGYLQRQKCRNVLAVCNVSDNASLRELNRELSASIAAHTFRLPLFEAEKQMEKGDYTLFDRIQAQLIEHMAANEYDAVFCPFDFPLEWLLFDGFPAELRRKVRLVTLHGVFPGVHSREYCRAGIVSWVAPHDQLIRTAVTRLEKWHSKKHAPVGVKKIRLVFEDQP
jgi:regulatory protein gntR HTH